jgi:hypothetical protein
MDELNSDEILAIYREALRPLVRGIVAITEEVKKALESAESSDTILLSMQTISKAIN